MPTPFPILYMQKWKDRIEIRRTVGETPYARAETLMRVPLSEPPSYTDTAVAPSGRTFAMICGGVKGAKGYFSALAPKPNGGMLRLGDMPETWPSRVFEAGPDAVVVGRMAGSDPGWLYLVRKSGKPLKIPDLGIEPGSAVVLGGRLLFNSYMDPGLVLWGPGHDPIRVSDERVDAVWPRNKIVRQGSRFRRLGWDGHRLRLGGDLASLSLRTYDNGFEIGRWLAFPEIYSAPNIRALVLSDPVGGRVARVKVPDGTTSVRPDGTGTRLLARSHIYPHYPARFTTHERYAKDVARSAVPSRDLLREGRWGTDWWTLDPKGVTLRSLREDASRVSTSWTHVRRFRSNGTGAFWP